MTSVRLYRTLHRRKRVAVESAVLLAAICGVLLVAALILFAM